MGQEDGPALTLSAWAPLGGVVVGAVLTAAIGWWGDRRRWRHEDARRWVADRRKLYADFIGAALRAQDFKVEHDGVRGLDQKAAAPEAWEAYGELYRAVQGYLADIELIASPRVVNAADHVVGELRHPEPEHEPINVGRRFTRALGYFRDAARLDLGIDEPLFEIPRRRRRWSRMRSLLSSQRGST